MRSLSKNSKRSATLRAVAKLRTTLDDPLVQNHYTLSCQGGCYSPHRCRYEIGWFHSRVFPRQSWVGQRPRPLCLATNSTKYSFSDAVAWVCSWRNMMRNCCCSCLCLCRCRKYFRIRHCGLGQCLCVLWYLRPVWDGCPGVKVEVAQLGPFFNFLHVSRLVLCVFVPREARNGRPSTMAPRGKVTGREDSSVSVYLSARYGGFGSRLWF